MVSKLIRNPRNSIVGVGVRIDFSKLIRNPRSYKSVKVRFACSRRVDGFDAIRRMSSKYIKSLMFRVRRNATTGFNNLVKISGAVHRPNGKA